MRSWVLVSVFLGVALCSKAQAWSNHALGSQLALSVLPEVHQGRVAFEPLEVFLNKEAQGLQARLEAQEAFAREHFAGYPKRPDALAFNAQQPNRQAFIEALRINPEVKLADFVQVLPGRTWADHPPLSAAQVTVFKQLDEWRDWQFVQVSAGEVLPVEDVLASAADEPDYGHDIHLFSDNPGTAGARYGFGAQPFGDPRFEFSSQAPFHIGYYHESPLVFAAGPFLKRTLPHWRVYQYTDLARFAFATGHPYWGYRFLGWSMHYLQDLTQPYHSTVMPNTSTARLLWIAAKDLAGFGADKAQAIEQIGTRHTELEHFQHDWLRLEQRQGLTDTAQLRSYKLLLADAQYPAFNEDYLAQVVAAQSHQRADALDVAVADWLASRPHTEPGQPLPAPRAEDGQFQQQVLKLLEHFGSHTRNVARAVLPSQP